MNSFKVPLGIQRCCKSLCSAAVPGIFSMAIYPETYSPQICKYYIIFMEYYTNHKNGSETCHI